MGAEDVEKVKRRTHHPLRGVLDATVAGSGATPASSTLSHAPCVERMVASWDDPGEFKFGAGFEGQSASRTIVLRYQR